jgi:outer membrane lipoprotein carrier protein
MLWMLLSSIVSLAAEPAAIPAEARAAWAQLATERLTARFEQVQHRSILAQPLRSTGRLAYAQPDKVRWEVEGPVRSVFVLNGARVSTAMPDLDHSETLDLSQSPEAARLVQGLMVWLGGDLERVARDYDLAWQAGPPPVATLTPRDPTLQKLLSRIVLQLEAGQIRRVTLHEPGGDRVEIALSDVAVDPALPEATFAPVAR